MFLNIYVMDAGNVYEKLMELYFRRSQDCTYNETGCFICYSGHGMYPYIVVYDIFVLWCLYDGSSKHLKCVFVSGMPGMASL